MPISVQLVSDLHLDVNGVTDFQTVLRPSAHYLICAGDIAEIRHRVLAKFLAWASDAFVHVYYVSGNHEFYGSSVMLYARNKLRDIASALSNVTVLECGEAKLPGNWTILGCTLWSDIGESVSAPWDICWSDFINIRGLTPKTYSFLHRNDRTWLQDRLKRKTPGEKLLVVTHHAPLTKGTSHPMYEDQPDRFQNRFFCTDLKDLVGQADVWCFGHTHFNRHQSSPYSNQLGYVQDSECPDYDPAFTITLD